jgi:hypothetical protein
MKARPDASWLVVMRMLESTLPFCSQLHFCSASTVTFNEPKLLVRVTRCVTINICVSTGQYDGRRHVINKGGIEMLEPSEVFVV